MTALYVPFTERDPNVTTYKEYLKSEASKVRPTAWISDYYLSRNIRYLLCSNRASSLYISGQYVLK
jgi:hypothetical protein